MAVLDFKVYKHFNTLNDMYFDSSDLVIQMWKVLFKITEPFKIRQTLNWKQNIVSSKQNIVSSKQNIVSSKQNIVSSKQNIVSSMPYAVITFRLGYWRASWDQ